MKKLLLILLGTLIVLPALAQEFTYTYEWQTLKYTVLDAEAKTCEVADGSNASGYLVIPSFAKYGNAEYAVVSIGKEAFKFCRDLLSVEIPSSVTSIGISAFSYCSGLTSLVIPNSVTTIDDYAFYDCSGLTSLTIGNSVTSIGDGAFYFCFDLTSVVIPNSVTSIGKWAFGYCPLTSIKIPSSVTSIGYDVFSFCSHLTSIEVSAENPNYASLNGVLFNKDFSDLIRCPGGKTGDYVISNTVISIGERAFCACLSMTSVTIPNSVTSIGDMAFYECYSVTSVEIPNSVTSIGDRAFYYCERLASIEVSAENPNYASLNGVLFNKDLSYLIQFPGGKTGDCEIPNSVTSIGNNAFNWCRALTSVEIPNSVTSIGDRAFYYCDGLTSLEIPNSVTYIGEKAFSSCDGLTSVYYGADEPIEGSEDIFGSSTYEKATLYMTEAGAERGRTIDPWKNFAKIEVYDPTDGIEAVDADIDFNQPCEVYSLSGAKVSDSADSLAPGIYILRQGNAVKKIAVKQPTF